MPVVRILARNPAPRRWLDLGDGAFLARSEREAWIAKLAQAGYPVYQQTEHTIYVRDPEGNRIGLSHWPQAR